MGGGPAFPSWTRDPWTFDPGRNQYYYYSEDEKAYVYQSGEKIPLLSHGNGGRPRTVAPNSACQDGLNGTDRQSAIVRREDTTQSVTDKLEAMGIESNYDSGRLDLDSNIQSYIQTEPVAEITDPALANVGVMAKGRLRGSLKGSEALFPDFKRRRDPRTFFVTGKVFKTLWPELLGHANESVTVTSEARFSDLMATKIRSFIVVKQGEKACTCLPIVTYNRQGVARRGVERSHHAIAYTSPTEPMPEDIEKPEIPMMPGIRIVPKHRRSRLDKMARVDFSRIYTIEHNVKVVDFGTVHPSHLARLQSQWIVTITDGGCGTRPSFWNVGENNEEVDKDVDEENDEEDEGED